MSSLMFGGTTFGAGAPGGGKLHERHVGRAVEASTGAPTSGEGVAAVDVAACDPHASVTDDKYAAGRGGATQRARTPK